MSLESPSVQSFTSQLLEMQLKEQQQDHGFEEFEDIPEDDEIAEAEDPPLATENEAVRAAKEAEVAEEAANMPDPEPEE